MDDGRWRNCRQEHHWVGGIILLRFVPTALRHVFRAAPWQGAALVALLALGGLVPVWTIGVTRVIVDGLAQVSVTGLTPRLLALAVALALAFAVDFLLAPWIAYVQGNVNERLTARVHLDLMEKAAGLPDLGHFENEKFHDELQVLRDGSSYQPLNVLVFLGSAFRELVTSVGVLVLLLSVAPVFPLLLLVAMLPPAILSFRLQRGVWDATVSSAPEARRLRYLSQTMMDTAYAKEVRLFKLLPLFRQRYLDIFRVWHGDLASARRSRALGASGLTLVSAFAAGVALVLGLRSVVAGVAGIGSLVLLVQSAGSLQRNFALLTEGVGMLHGSLLYFRNFDRFLSMAPGIAINKNPQKVAGFKEIRFDNVSFTYPNGHVALKSVSFSLRKGERLAVVGPNGAGKTTMVKLLLRYHDPSSGRILVDGVNLANLDVESWRLQISAVFQDFGRYSLTMQENIAIGDLNAFDDAERLHVAAAKGGADALLERIRPNSILSREFGGTELSLGEWQRIALSRAFFRNAPLVVLDEPTAAIDPKEEAHLYQRFADLAQDSTVVLITHRLGSVRQAKRILVLDEGRLVEEGTHDELVERGQVYAELWQLQAESYRAG